MANATPTTGETTTDPFTALLDILHTAAAQDGTLETAQESLHTIEDLAMAAVGHSLCPDLAGA